MDTTNDDYICYLPITSEATLQNCCNLDVSTSKTVYITSYPKSGTTWMQACVYSLLSGGNEIFDHISDFAPFYEADRTWNSDGNVAEKYFENHINLGCRIFNTHLRWEKVAHGDNAIYVYVYRDGKDAVTSFFHHLSNQADSGGFNGTFEDFFQDWMANKIPFGSWAKHVKNWVTAASNPDNRVLLVSYEDMKADLCSCLVRVADHLGLAYSREEIETTIMPKVSFEYMKANKHQFQPVSVGWKNGFEFIRNGKVGDSVNLFSPEQHAAFDAMMATEFPNGLDEWIRSNHGQT
jgi:hypothetical protein